MKKILIAISLLLVSVIQANAQTTTTQPKSNTPGSKMAHPDTTGNGKNYHKNTQPGTILDTTAKNNNNGKPGAKMNGSSNKSNGTKSNRKDTLTNPAGPTKTDPNGTGVNRTDPKRTENGTGNSPSTDPRDNGSNSNGNPANGTNVPSPDKTNPNGGSNGSEQPQ